MHHGGLLPLLKETIEILFGEQLIKVETWAVPQLLHLLTKCIEYPI